MASNVIYIGDVNINILKENSITRNCQSLLNNNGFLSVIDIPTRIANDSQTCIDHIFIRCKNIGDFISGVFDIGLTDHCILCIKNIKSVTLSTDKAMPIDSVSVTAEKRTLDINLVVNKLLKVD